MKFEISSSPVRAVIVTHPLISVPAFVMNILEPSITHSPSSTRAVVRVAPASEPASGSVSPNAASALARGQRGKPLGPLAARRRRGMIGIVPSEVCAATVIANEESMRASSSMQSA